MKKKSQATGGPLFRGAPPWLVTLGDSMTLLLTFFVLLYTFSAPEKAKFDAFAQGVKTGLGKGVFDPGSKNTWIEMVEALRKTRVGPGSKPPWFRPVLSNVAEEMAQRLYPDLKMEEVESFQGSLLIRIPQASLFDANDALTTDGLKRLNVVTTMLVAKPCRVIVRSDPAGGASKDEKAARAVKQSMTIVARLSSDFPPYYKHLMFRVSSDIELVSTPLPEGQCEIYLIAEN